LPERFESRVYAAETTKLMKDAFEAAWPTIKLVESDVELTRQLLASSIIDQVDCGASDHDTIVSVAIAALAIVRDAPRSP
jgi:hypothetical protein